MPRHSAGPGPYLVAAAVHLGLLADELLGALEQEGRVAASLGQDAPRQAVGLLQQRLHQVFRLHHLLAARTSRASQHTPVCVSAPGCAQDCTGCTCGPASQHRQLRHGTAGTGSHRQRRLSLDGHPTTRCRRPCRRSWRAQDATAQRLLHAGARHKAVVPAAVPCALGLRTSTRPAHLAACAMSGPATMACHAFSVNSVCEMRLLPPAARVAMLLHTSRFRQLHSRHPDCKKTSQRMLARHLAHLEAARRPRRTSAGCRCAELLSKSAAACGSALHAAAERAGACREVEAVKLLRYRCWLCRACCWLAESRAPAQAPGCSGHTGAEHLRPAWRAD